MAMMYVPPRQNNMQNQLFSVLSNLMFQKMAFKQRMEISDKKLQYDKMLVDATLKREQQKEIRDRKVEGWREPEAQKPVIEIGDTGLIPPQTGLETRDVEVGGQKGTVPVETMTPYGGQKQITNVGSIKTTTPKSSRPIKVEQFNPQTGLTDIYLAENVDGQWKVGGSPVGRKQPTGFKFSSDPEGNVQFVSGQMGAMGQPGELTRSAKAKFQKEVDSLSGQRQRLETMAQTFKPEYLRWGNKALFEITAIKEKLQGLGPLSPKISPEEKQKLAEYTQWRSSSLQNFSALIHDLAGGTLTKHEAKIHGKWIASAQKNSETEYMANLKQNYETTTKQLARKHYYLNMQNMSPTEFHKLRKQNKLMSTAQFDAVIDEKYAQEIAKLRQQQPNAPYEKLKTEALNIIEAAFFGF